MRKNKKKRFGASKVIEVKKNGQEKKGFNNIIYLIMMVIIGLILLLLPETSNKLIGYIIGIFILLLAVIAMIKYIKEIPANSMFLVKSLLYFIIAILILIYPLLIMKCVTLILGIYFIIHSALKIQKALLLKKMLTNAWQVPFISGIIIMIFGLILIINPFSGLIITKIAGAFLVLVSSYEIIIRIKNKQN